MRLGHPGGDGVGGRAHDDLDAGLAHGVDDAVHPGVLEVAVGGLPEAPGGLAHAHYADAGVFHQGDVFLETAGLQVGGHVLVVVGGAVENIGMIAPGGGVESCAPATREARPRARRVVRKRGLSQRIMNAFPRPNTS